MAEYLHLKPSGRICLSEGLHGFQQSTLAALNSAENRIYLDLKDVTYIDSSGLGEIVKLYLESRKAGKKMVLVSPTPAIRKILHSSKLDKVFTLADTIEAAAAIP